MEELKENIEDIRQRLENMYSNIDDMLYDIDNLDFKMDSNNMILDLQLFKDKLHLYDLDTEELLNFIDLYMRLYNKE